MLLLAREMIVRTLTYLDLERLELLSFALREAERFGFLPLSAIVKSFAWIFEMISPLFFSTFCDFLLATASPDLSLDLSLVRSLVLSLDFLLVVLERNRSLSL